MNNTLVAKTTKVQCKLCKNMYASSSSLSRHRKVCKVSLSVEQDTLKNKLKNYEELEKKSIKKIKCNFCDNTFKSSANLSNHVKICGKKKEMDNIIEQLNKDNSQLTKSNEMLLRDKEMYYSITGEAVKSMSAMRFFMTNYTQTPKLQRLDDYSDIKNDKTKNTKDFILHLISKYNNNLLVSYIGDYIVQIYKTDDPSKQPMWNSDVTRLTYVIRDAVVKSKLTWLTDKKGLIVGERIIRPALEYIKPLIINFTKMYSKQIIPGKLRINKQMEILEYLKASNEIIVSIDNFVLEKEIIKYIAPIFYWNKNNLIECDDDYNLDNTNVKNEPLINIIDNSEDELIEESD
jgi:hypothetical protein